MDKIEQLQNSRQSQTLFSIGAGVSTESNIPDFRSSGSSLPESLNWVGIFLPEQLVSHTMFVRYPEEFFDFLKASRMSRS